MLAALASAGLQLLAALAVAYPFRRGRGEAGFFARLGFYAPERRSALLGLALAGLSLLPLIAEFLSSELLAAVTGPHTPAGRLRAAGFSAEACAVLLAQALLQTSLSEEVLFRGVLLKSLRERIGFERANAWQAALFGLMHLAIFAAIGTSLPILLLLTPYTGAFGWALGWVNEKGNGSIVPGWIAHGLGNAISYAILAWAA